MEQFRPEIVSGDRVYLSHFDLEDSKVTAVWMSDLEVTTHLGSFGGVFGIEDQVEWIERARRDKFNPTFSIVIRESRKMIGSLSLKNVNHKRGVAELGVLVGDKTEWGKGYGSEAVRLISDYAFTLLDLKALHLWYWDFNSRARRAYLRAGFKDAGRLRSAGAIGEKRYDYVLMDLTREDFGPSKLAAQIHLGGAGSVAAGGDP